MEGFKVSACKPLGWTVVEGIDFMAKELRIVSLETVAEMPKGPSGLITSIQFDGEMLRILVDFEVSLATVLFDHPDGFRVLEERHLQEFWGPPVRACGIVYRVTGAGWLAQESERDFLMSMERDRLKEYLVVGDLECVNVLASESPEVSVEAK